MAFDIQFKLIYQGIRDVFRVRSLSNLYINAQGGVYMGTFQIGTNPRLLRVYRTDDRLGRRWFGNGTERDYISCGTWDMGKDLYIRFIPAGATYLPIRFLMVPEKESLDRK